MTNLKGTDREIASLAAYIGEDWAARRRAERETEAETMRVLRAALLAAAREAGAATITVAYTGGYDSGAIEDLTIEPETAATALAAARVERASKAWAPEAKAWRPTTEQIAFRNCVEDLLTWALTEEVGNWWDGDIETDGEIVWHVADEPDRIEGDHSECVKRYESSAWEA
jgi:hypothetical protein